MRKQNVTFIILAFTLLSNIISAQSPISWEFALEDKGEGKVNIVATATVESGWYMYDTDIPDGGPNPTSISFDIIKGAEVSGKFSPMGKNPAVKYDDMFQMEFGTHTGTTKFAQTLIVTDKEMFSLAGDVRAQACNGATCTPPLPVEFAFSSKDLPATVTAIKNDASGSKDATAGAGTNESAAANSDTETDSDAEASSNEAAIRSDAAHIDAVANHDMLWSPVTEELKAFDSGTPIDADDSLWDIFLKGLIWGFAALLTPCVWPMIPITVSFFLNKNSNKRAKAISDAIFYAIFIIVIYVLLGLIVTAIFGPSALNNLATSTLFNLIFFALLLIFAFSFLGAFEIILPSSWANKLDSKADSKSGLVSIFFMAFTLAVVSFSCTGPIVGWLLVEAATQGKLLAPATGMFGFALALSIPFALLAIFPSWLKSLPKSGGWLNSVKVVLGLIMLAVSLKFLSIADLTNGWGILPREVFFSIWIVIFAFMGFYLLGKIKLPGDSDLKQVSITRLILSLLIFSFTVYMIPGLWGAPLKPLSSIAPPMYTQDFKPVDDSNLSMFFDDYEAGVAYAIQKDKPILLQFAGHGCVNCHKMDATVFADERVIEKINNNFVTIRLMVDEKAKLPEVIEVQNRDGKTTKLKTVGDKWSYLESYKFGIQSQPLYVLLDHQGKPLAPARSYDENIDAFLNFLDQGLSNFNKR